MKILYCDYNSRFVWSDAVLKDNNYFYVAAQNRDVPFECVFDVQGKMPKYCKCSNCGEMIPYTKTAMEKHKKEHTTLNGCLHCSRLRSYPVGEYKYKRTAKGMIMTAQAHLECNYSWHNNNIVDKPAECCKFKGCQNANFIKVETFWDKYPHAFDVIATVDTILKVGFKKIQKGYSYENYTLKGKHVIEAHVTPQGLVQYFLVHKRNHLIWLRYSVKYDKLFLASGQEILPCWYMSAQDCEEIKKQIKKLYKV